MVLESNLYNGKAIELKLQLTLGLSYLVDSITLSLKLNKIIGMYIAKQITDCVNRFAPMQRLLAYGIS